MDAGEHTANHGQSADISFNDPKFPEQNHSLNHVQPKGGQAVLQVLKQLATYDEVEHESKLADDIIACSDDPHNAQPAEVLRALLNLLRDQGEGRDTELTCQALRFYNNIKYGADTPVGPAELGAVLEAQQFASQLSSVLEQIVFRPVHGIGEALAGSPPK